MATIEPPCQSFALRKVRAVRPLRAAWRVGHRRRPPLSTAPQPETTSSNGRVHAPGREYLPLRRSRRTPARCVGNTAARHLADRLLALAPPARESAMP